MCISTAAASCVKTQSQKAGIALASAIQAEFPYLFQQASARVAGEERKRREQHCAHKTSKQQMFGK